MNAKYDIMGRTFGRLTVIGRAPNVVHHVNGKCPQSHRAWFVRCECGGEMVAKGAELRRGTTVSCGCRRREAARARARKTGPAAIGWRGGRSTQPNGYVRLRRVTCVDGVERINQFEHTVVLEAFLGRRLTKNESVHHKNGVRSDNRLENLELWHRGQPAGQRTDDKVAWAREFLRQHDPAFFPLRPAYAC